MGRLLVNEALPEDMRDDNRVLDKKGSNQLLQELAQKHPEKYVEVSKKLSDIGRTVATEFGGYTFGLQHLRTSAVAKRNRIAIQRKMQQILSRDDITPEQRKQLIVKTVGSYQQKQIDDIYDEAVKANNPLAMQVVSGSRGNKMNLGSLLGGDMLYSDHRDDVIPLPVLSSYSEGLKPMEYWASMYGARRGTMATKFATQDAGYLSKQLNQVSHRLMVVGDDDERDLPDRGLPVDTDDGDNEGSLLAKDVGPYKRNTALTPKILKHIKSLGHDRILVRSPLIGGSPDGGVYARDVGVREKGTLPGRGEQVGLTAAQALSEPLAQGQLSAKHSGGVAGQEKAVGGFAYINQLIQVPKVFKGGATHSEKDGTVSAIEEAPAGGNYVWIGDQRHYVPAGVELKVKKGDSVEAGDVITEGFPNPAVITEHKGIGEGKRYFVNAFRKAMQDAGMKVNRRNVELLARGLINHVKLTDEYGDNVPDDVVPYSTMEHLYEPREGHEELDPKKALGKYLERPVLHYSIGTKVRPSVLKELQHFGVNSVAVHKDPAPFQSNMIRGMYSLQYDPDWMTRMYGSGLKSSLLDATHHGAVSDELGTSFVPGLARAVDFGRVGAVRSSEKGTAPPPEGQPFGDPRAKSPVSQAPSIAAPIKPKEDKPKPTGLFKLSADELQQEALALIKAAAMSSAPKVDTTTPGSTGSSTAAPVTATRNPMPGSTGANNAPGQSRANNYTFLPNAAGPPTPPSVPAVPQAPTATAVPGTPTTPAAPGEIHPGRVRDNAWTDSVQRGPYKANTPFTGAANSSGILTQFDDPEMAANFVAGGGDRNNPGSGFGGHFGDIARFGSLLDSDAVASLTYGQNGAPRQFGDGSDSLIGDNDAIVPKWNGLLGQQNDPAKPNAMQAKPQAPALPPIVPTAVPNLSQPDALVQQIAKMSGWESGNKQFDAFKATLGANTTDQQAQQKMMDSARRAYLLKKNGYEPGQPKFEETRKQLNGQILQTVGGDPGKRIADLQEQIVQLKASEPANPDIPEMEKTVQELREFQTTGVPNDYVMQHLMTNVAPEGDVSDYELLQEAKGANSWWQKSLHAWASPVTGSAVHRMLVRPMYNGARDLFRNKVEREIARKARDEALKRAGKGLLNLAKRVPLLNIGVETAMTALTSDDELRAKFEDKMRPREGIWDNAGNILDNVINPGANIGASSVVLQDTWKNHNANQEQAQRTDINQAAHAHAYVQYLEQAARRRVLTADEQEKLVRNRKIVQDADAKHISTNKFVNQAWGGDKANAQYLSTQRQLRTDAEQTYKNVRLQHGKGVADKVLNNTASPYDKDAFKEWLGEELTSLQLSPGTPANVQRVTQLQQLAERAAKVGNTSLAFEINDAIAADKRRQTPRAAPPDNTPARFSFMPQGPPPLIQPLTPTFSDTQPPAAGIGGFNFGKPDASMLDRLQRRQIVDPGY